VKNVSLNSCSNWACVMFARSGIGADIGPNNRVVARLFHSIQCMSATRRGLRS